MYKVLAFKTNLVIISLLTFYIYGINPVQNLFYQEVGAEHADNNEFSGKRSSNQFPWLTNYPASCQQRNEGSKSHGGSKSDEPAGQEQLKKRDLNVLQDTKSKLKQQVDKNHKSNANLNQDNKSSHLLRKMRRYSRWKKRILQSQSSKLIRNAIVQEIPEEIVNFESSTSEKTNNIEAPNSLNETEDSKATSPSLDKSGGELIRAENATTPPTNTSLKEENEASGGVPEAGSSEQIPSFDEWKKQRLEEHEKTGQNIPQSVTNQKPKAKPKIKKNYASSDCGAKILATNPEAHHSSHILNAFKDEYMLNPCNDRIWFVVELCESIQSHTLEMANFELFSSMPKEFSIYVSERYPSKEWTLLGNFNAGDERVIQEFPLSRQIFGKFVKVELFSHYGSEHYCPLSLFQIYGTSMVEEIEDIETLESSGDDDEDKEDTLSSTMNGSDQNLFGSAKDAVLQIVKTATKVFTGEEDRQHVINGSKEYHDVSKALSESQLRELSNVDVDVSITNISRMLYELNKTLGLIDYKEGPNIASFHFLLELSKVLNTCTACAPKAIETNNATSKESSICQYLQVIIGKRKFNVLCQLFKRFCHENSNEISLKQFESYSSSFVNHLIQYLCSSRTSEDIGYQNSSLDRRPSIMENLTFLSGVGAKGDKLNTFHPDSREASTKHGGAAPDLDPTPVLTHGSNVEKSASSVDSSSSVNSQLNTETSDIKPSSVITDVNAGSVTEQPSVTLPESNGMDPSDKSNETLVEVENFVLPNVISYETTNPKVSGKDGNKNGENVPEKMEPIATQSNDDQENVNISSVEANQATIEESSGEIDMNIGIQTLPTSSQTFDQVSSQSNGGYQGIAPPNTQKESVFMRINNRIKSLELNLSLTNQYLEELSKRYRKQMDGMTEMQKAFNRSMAVLNETSHLSSAKSNILNEKVAQLEAKLEELSRSYSSLTKEKETIASLLMEWHLIMVAVELILMVIIFVACLRYNIRSLAKKFRQEISNNRFDMTVLPEVISQNTNTGTTDHIEESAYSNECHIQKKRKSKKKHSKGQFIDIAPSTTNPGNISKARPNRISLDSLVSSHSIVQQKSMVSSDNLKHSSAGLLFQSSTQHPRNCTSSIRKNNFLNSNNQRLEDIKVNGNGSYNKYRPLYDLNRVENVINENGYKCGYSKKKH